MFSISSICKFEGIICIWETNFIRRINRLFSYALMLRKNGFAPSPIKNVDFTGRKGRYLFKILKFKHPV